LALNYRRNVTAGCRVSNWDSQTRLGEAFPLACPRCSVDIRLIVDGRQEPASFEPEVRKRKKARMASTA